MIYVLLIIYNNGILEIVDNISSCFDNMDILITLRYIFPPPITIYQMVYHLILGPGAGNNLWDLII